MKDNKVIFVIDAQSAFINNENDKRIEKAIIDKVKGDDYDILITAEFINYMNSKFRSLLNYDECMLEEDRVINHNISKKSAYHVRHDNYSCIKESTKEFLRDHDIKEVELVGFNLEDCIMATALHLFNLGIKVKINSSLVSSRDDKVKEASLICLQHQLGKDAII